MLLMVPIAANCGLYAWGLRESIGHPILSDIKVGIPLNIRVVDDVTGRPIRGAGIFFPMLNPEWRARPEMANGDLNQNLNPGVVLQPSAITEYDGAMKPGIGTMGWHERRLKSTFLGLLPVAGAPEIRLPPTSGIRVAANGYETWTAFLEDVAASSGKPLVNGVPLSVEVRLKRSKGSD